MTRSRLRTPAVVPRPPVPAVPWADDPARQVVAHFEQVWATSMHDMPFVNPALAVEAVGFQRVSGDWLGIVITPWFINVFLLPGGGCLWVDTPSGEQRGVLLPVGNMAFIADNPGAPALLPAYQYCPLLAPVQQVADPAQARLIAEDALATVLGPQPPTAPEATVVRTPENDAEVTSPARRGFLRALAPRRV